ncbi:hypothetical protein PMIN01_13564 [Paraphaeosphaeria minitans]|uniref:Hypervirulence associated protein TUDOR domain-containing protein n=1 Tax=Paraphaeosphaeria minitans TaxID=565426 RepID=A0A9P6G4D5_9PLEO|nr:hypothetical protein PMIN01_13564 [Paraphaeosphaeria minitans]
MPTKNEEQVLSKQGKPIEKGDHVYTKIRGGRHEGDVEKIINSEQEAKEENLKNLPKVLFTDQKGKPVAHNPGTLDVIDDSGK